MFIGNKIRKIRELRGYTEEYLAHRLGMSQNNFSKIELGKVTLSLERIEEIAKVLDIDPIKLIEFDESLIFNNNNQSGGNAANVINQILSDKVVEQYEKRITGLEKEIEFLKMIIQNQNTKQDKKER